MNGKINIVFGFFYLACTAALGPTVLVPKLGPANQQFEAAAKNVEAVRAGGESSQGGVAPATVGIFDYLKSQKGVASLAGGPHAHGNLESLLNIAAGVVLLMLTIPANFKALISIVFILGAVFHSGMLYLGMVFGQAWAFKLTKFGAIAVLTGLVLMGIASIIGLKKKEG